MAKKTINIGSSINAGDGDPLRTAFDKINDNFDELYSATTLDLDNIGSNMIPDTDGAYALGSASNQWSDLYVKDFVYIGNARLQADAQGNLVVNGASIKVDGDVSGSIFADDSTLLVDAINGKIVGPVEANVTGNLTGNVTGNLTGNVTGNVTGNIVGNTTGYHTGDVTGSVFADNSTVLIDGVAGTINASALTGTLPAINGSALTGVALELSITSQTTSEAGLLGKNNVSTNRTPAIAKNGIVNITRAGSDTGNDHYVYLGDGSSIGSVVYVTYDNAGASTTNLFVLTEESILNGSTGGRVPYDQMAKFIWNGSVWYRIEISSKVD